MAHLRIVIKEHLSAFEGLSGGQISEIKHNRAVLKSLCYCVWMLTFYNCFNSQACTTGVKRCKSKPNAERASSLGRVVLVALLD